MKWCRLPIGIEPIVSLGSLFVSLSYSISRVTIRLCWWTAQTTGKNPANPANFLLSLFCFPVGIDSVVLCGFKVGGFKKKKKKKTKGLSRHQGCFSGGKIICTHTTWQPPVIIQRWWHLPNPKLLVDTFSSSYQSHANHMLITYGPPQPNNSKYSDFQNAPCLTVADAVSCVVVQSWVVTELVVAGVTVASRWSPDSNQSAQSPLTPHFKKYFSSTELLLGSLDIFSVCQYVNPWDGCDAVRIPADQQFVGNPFWHQRAGYFFLSLLSCTLQTAFQPYQNYFWLDLHPRVWELKDVPVTMATTHQTQWGKKRLTGVSNHLDYKRLRQSHSQWMNLGDNDVPFLLGGQNWGCTQANCSVEKIRSERVYKSQLCCSVSSLSCEAHATQTFCTVNQVIYYMGGP